MRPDKFSLAKAWINDERSTPEEAKATWEAMGKEFDENRKTMLMASAESDKIKAMMNKKYGPGTMKYGSEIKQPEIKTPQAIFEFGQRNPAADGGRMLNAMQVGEAMGNRTGFRKPRGPAKITDFPLEIQERIKEFGIKKYNKLNNQQKYAVRNQPTSTTPYTFNFGKNKFDITVKGLTKKGANNVQELLNIINKEELTPENWFAKTSRKQGKKGGASAGVDAMARDLVKYLKGEAIGERTAIHQIIFDQLNIKDLIGDKADIIKDIDGKSFRQTKGTAGASKSAVESSFDAVKLLNKEFILDPDVTLAELAETLYGKGASNSVRAMKDTQLDILKYLDVLKTGTRRNIKMPADFKFPSTDKMYEILDSIEDRSGTFGFQDGAVRDLKFNIRDNLLNFKKGSTMDLRRLLGEIMNESDLAGRVIDESVGLSATYDKMPGYTEATQMLPDELNKYKAFKVDKPFNEVLNKIYAETATPKDIKDYNKVARAFIKETRADAPIIRSSILNDDLKNVKKYVKNFDDFSSAAQEDILDVAKKNKIIIETKANPLTLTEGKTATESAQKFFDKNKNLKYKNMIKSVGCPVKGKAEGGRIGFAEGADCFDKGQKLINNGMKGASPASLKNLAKIGPALLKAGSAVMSGLIVPEALIVGLETAARVGYGDTPSEAILRATDYLTPDSFFGNYMQKADLMKIERILGKDVKNIAAQSFARTDQVDKINSLEEKLKNLEAMSESGNFGYIGDLTNQINMTQDQIKKEKEDLENKFTTTGQESKDFYTQQAFDDAYDASIAKSKFAAKSLADSESENPRLSAEQAMQDMKSQEELNKGLSIRSPLTGSKGETDFLKLSQLPLGPRMPSEIDILAKAMNKNFAEQGSKNRVNIATLKAYQDNKQMFKDASMEEMIDMGVPLEAILGFNQAQPVETEGPGYYSNYKPLNRFGSQERTVLYPKSRGTLAEGGITGLKSKYEYKK